MRYLNEPCPVCRGKGGQKVKDGNLMLRDHCLICGGTGKARILEDGDIFLGEKFVTPKFVVIGSEVKL